MASVQGCRDQKNLWINGTQKLYGLALRLDEKTKERGVKMKGNEVAFKVAAVKYNLLNI